MTLWVGGPGGQWDSGELGVRAAVCGSQQAPGGVGMHGRVLVSTVVTSSLGPLAGARGRGRVGSNASLCFPEERWSSYCLSSLAAQNICTSKLHCSATPGQTDLAGSLGSTSCCSLLRGLSLGWSPPLLPAPVCNPNKAVFTVDAKTTEVRAAGCDPASSLGSAASAYCLRRAPERVSAARRMVGSTSVAARAMTLETSV